MNFTELKLKIIEHILEPENPELLENIADLLSREPRTFKGKSGTL